MIENILPSGIAAAELLDFPDDLRAHPAEEHLIANAVDKRRRDFIGARHCARQALVALGEQPVAIGKGERGAPVWPRGIVGSLTHCDGYRAAALGHRLRFRSVGIDAEPHGALPAGVLDSVSLPQEREWLRADESGLHLDRLLFCAKEATFKAWFPLTARWLGFEDAHITFTVDEAVAPDPAASSSGSDSSKSDSSSKSDTASQPDTASGSGTFRSELLVPGQVNDGGAPLTSFEGRWLITGGLILTAIAHA